MNNYSQKLEFDYISLQKFMDKISRLRLHEPIRNVSSQKTFSLNYLRNLNSKLETEKQQSKLVHEKMKQEISLSTKIGAHVGQSIQKVETDGAFYASKLQEQKRKHKALVSLVNHYEERIEREKLNNHIEMMKTRVVGKNVNQTKDNRIVNKRNYLQIKSTRFTEGETSRNHELQQISRGLNELQKNYDQFVLKNNARQYELSKKLDEVRTLRSERTIFNKMFDQFEKELFRHEFQYKELVIEKSILQSEFEDKVKIFESLSLNVHKQFSKLMKLNKKKLATDRLLQNFLSIVQTKRCCKQDISDYFRRQFREDNQKSKSKREIEFLKNQQKHKNLSLLENSVLKFPRIEEAFESSRPMKQKRVYQQTESSNNSERLQSEKGRSKAQISYLQIDQENLEGGQKDKFEYKKKVKQIFEELGVCSSEDLPIVVENLDKEIEKLYVMSQQLYQKFYKKERFLESYLERKKKSDKVLLNKGLEMVTPRDNENVAMEEEINKKQFLRFQIQQAQLQYLHIEQQIQRFCNQEVHKIAESIDPEYQRKDEQNSNQEKFEKIMKIQSLLADILTQSRKFPEISSLSKEFSKTIEFKEVHEKIGGNYKKKKESKHKLDHRKESSNANSTGNQLLEGEHSCHPKQGNRMKKKTEYGENGSQVGDLQVCKLEQLLKENRVTHNNTTIFTEEELIEISRRKINQSKKGHSYSEAIKSQFVIAQTKSYEQITRSSKKQFTGGKMIKE